MHIFKLSLGTRFLTFVCSIAFGVGAQAQPINLTPLPPVTPTLSDIPSRVVACSKIVANEVRIRCFDEITAVVVEMTRAASARNQFAWSVQDTGTNRERKVTVAIASSEAIVGTDTTSMKNSFFLVASCSGGQISAYVAFPDKAYEAPMEVITRRDDRNGQIMLYPSESGRAMGLWNNGSALEFISNLSSMNSIGFDFKDTRMPVILNFDVRGAADALKPLYSACPRQS